jgi:ParB family transcriptional regulator, chromosome partitioning protein
MASKIKQFSSTIGALLNENFGELSESAPKITQKKASQNILAASAGKRKQVAVLSVDPKRCRLWHLHNRDQQHLTETSCKDLIDSIRLNGQLEPALVRELTHDADYDFEIIYGSRRKYACSVLRQDLLVRVTTADDRECAALMDAENRARKDISDYERALDYMRWLGAGCIKLKKIWRNKLVWMRAI